MWGFLMADERDAIFIDWFGELFCWWCWKCREMKMVYRSGDDLRCTGCNWKMGEKPDVEYVKMLKGNGTIQ